MSNNYYIPEQIDLTPEQHSFIKQIFDHFDINNDGKLNYIEASQIMLKYDVDQIFMPIAFEICDINKDNSISYDEFHLLYNLLGDLEDDPSIIYRNLFDKFDLDHNGFLEEEELYNFFRFIFKDISDQHILFYTEYFNKNNDGKLDFEEIVKILNILTEKKY